MLTKKDSSKNTSKTTKTITQPSQPSSYAVAKAPNQQPAKVSHPHSPHTCSDQCTPTSGRPSQKKTCLTIKYDVGFNNQLCIRGKGAGLCWEKGQPLKNKKADEWIWESDADFSQCEFKVLINDTHYEAGENHLLNCGASMTYTPHFC